MMLELISYHVIYIISRTISREINLLMKTQLSWSSCTNYEGHCSTYATIQISIETLWNYIYTLIYRIPYNQFKIMIKHWCKITSNISLKVFTI